MQMKIGFLWSFFIRLSVAVIIFGSISPSVASAASKYDSTSRMVTFYDNGEEKTIVTKSQTVGEALKDAKLKLRYADSINLKLDHKLDNFLTVVNIKRSRPVVVVDGNRVNRIMTPETNILQAVKDANIKLKPSDRVDVRLIKDDLLAYGGAGIEAKISRANTVNLKLYGQRIKLRTLEKTVGDFLKRSQIKPAKSDKVSLSLDTPVTDNMYLEIWREGLQTTEEEEEIPFETEEVKDPSKKIGFYEVTQPGKKGKKTVIYEVNIKNGQEIGRSKVSEVVVEAPEKRIEVRGTKVELPPGSHQDWMAMAGIPESDYGATNFIISRESGWRYNARNPSGAYGLPQALPGGKMASAGGDWETNPITQLRWFHSYCVGRYGSIQGAYDYWQVHKSY